MLQINFDISGLIEKNKEIADKIVQRAQELTTTLTLQTYDYIIQEAQQQLHSRRQTFIDNWQHEQLDPNTHQLTILGPAQWIDEGLPENFHMLPGLLKNSNKTDREGNRIAIIPFKHNKPSSERTNTQKILTNIVKKELKKKNIPFKKIETNPDGSPKTGILHKLDITQPTKAPDGKSLESVTQLPKGGTVTRHFLEGLRVYQKATKDGGTKKDIMTFRTANEKDQNSKWIHPGTPAMNFLDKAKTFAEKTWEEDLLPQLMTEFGLD